MLPKFRLNILGIILLLTAFNAVGSDLNGENSKSSSGKQQPLITNATASSKYSDKEKVIVESTSNYKIIEWDDLIPENDLNALLNPPSYINNLEDSSFENNISDPLQNVLITANNDRYQQALTSRGIIQEMNGRAIGIPGFVVPVEFDEELITEFFLVPYFGACIHSPPPPPNQIIYVHAPTGLKLNSLYDPFWIYGTIGTSLVENHMATAAYSIQMQSYDAYTE